MLLIVVKVPVRAEVADSFLERVAPFTAATRAEAGNVSFDWYRSSEDPTAFLLVEAFLDGDAGAAHVGSPHFQQAMAEFPALIEDVPQIVNVDVPDGWAAMAELSPGA